VTCTGRLQRPPGAIVPLAVTPTDDGQVVEVPAKLTLAAGSDVPNVGVGTYPATKVYVVLVGLEISTEVCSGVVVCERKTSGTGVCATWFGVIVMITGTQAGLVVPLATGTVAGPQAVEPDVGNTGVSGEAVNMIHAV